MVDDDSTEWRVKADVRLFVEKMGIMFGIAPVEACRAVTLTRKGGNDTVCLGLFSEVSLLEGEKG